MLERWWFWFWCWCDNNDAQSKYTFLLYDNEHPLRRSTREVQPSDRGTSKHILIAWLMDTFLLHWPPCPLLSFYVIDTCRSTALFGRRVLQFFAAKLSKLEIRQNEIMKWYSNVIHPPVLKSKMKKKSDFNRFAFAFADLDELVWWMHKYDGYFE